ncbi:MAG: GntR family transcriptional regulator [Phototrophicaceae bacterium]
MLQTKSSKPLYEQIKDYILHHILTGEWEANSRIPSERALAEKFEVSRVTVGKAVKELVHSGHLYVQIGKGTYINDAPMKQQIETLTSFTEEMNVRGQKTTSRVISASIKKPDDETAKTLNIPTDMSVMELRRVRYVGQRPMAIECTSVIASLCPDILDNNDFTHESLYSVLQEDYDVRLIYADQTFEARVATKEESQLLEISDGAPVLAIYRVTYNDKQIPCEEVKSVYRGDRYKFRAKLSKL